MEWGGSKKKKSNIVKKHREIRRWIFAFGGGVSLRPGIRGRVKKKKGGRLRPERASAEVGPNHEKVLDMNQEKRRGEEEAASIVHSMVRRVRLRVIREGGVHLAKEKATTLI